MDELILMKLYMRMCTKEENLELKSIKGDNYLWWTGGCYYCYRPVHILYLP